MSPSPRSDSQLDQAARLRKLVADAKQRVAARSIRVLMLGATAQSGTMRLFSQLSMLAREAASVDLEFVVSSPGPEATLGRLFSEADARVLVVSPEEDEIVAAFATLKVAQQAGVDISEFMVVGSRCDDGEDSRFVSQTLRSVCKQHLGAELSMFVAVPDHAGPQRERSLAEILAKVVELTGKKRLAS